MKVHQWISAVLVTGLVLSGARRGDAAPFVLAAVIIALNFALWYVSDRKFNPPGRM